MNAPRIPDEVIEKARALDVYLVANRYGFAARPSHSGEAIGPCPGCGGRDRFAVNTRKNVWSCRQGAGDPIGGDAVALVRHVEKCSFPRAVEILTGEGAIESREHAAPDPQAENEFREKERRRAFQLWREGRPFEAGGPVARYLALRGIDPALARLPGAHCREHGALPFWHFCNTGRTDAQGRPIRKWKVIYVGPAMLWPIQAPDNRFLGLHATWIDLDRPKGKAEIFDPDTGEQLPAKKVRGSKKGGRIVLKDGIKASPFLGVAEGVESALSWWAMGRAHEPAASLETSIDLGNLAGRAVRSVSHPTAKITRTDGRQMPVRAPGPDPKPDEDHSLLWAPHPGVMHLTLIGELDGDPFASRAAYLRAKARLSGDGMPLGDGDIVIDWPPEGHDFNSLLMASRAAPPPDSGWPSGGAPDARRAAVAALEAQQHEDTSA